MIYPMGIIRHAERHFMRKRLQDLEILPVAAVTLRMLHELGACNQDTLGAKLEMDKGRIAKLLAHLEETGQVHRVVNPHNKREKIVVLTALGQNTVEKINQIVIEWNDFCLQGFSEVEKSQYFAFLSRISENLTQSKSLEKCD